MNHKSSTGLLLALVCAAAFGQVQEDVPAAGSAVLPPPQTVNGITYVCGGIGSDEAEQMKQSAAKYDLMLTFATPGGAFLSDVKVDIADARGQALLTTVCNGPIMLVDLPREGRYRVRGELAGNAASGTALLRRGDRGKPLHLTMPGAQGASG